ncbi:uncharacterized protein MONBRDRAFT_23250 [Monosiga brevicollis MX1]|uniref:Radial spoke head protein 9 homolog n=1 Tax=Monosiga brevicollis TaxID=81824 RepID=A9URM0_MONBE|nr:uncharacterized protein MONBRDRAFT_23250 [Monosiga brevicollis MX1]EDQ91947.1 predicted protein [Monosiga brevicollis MX1]|eukprot:XP_001743233.1 hypothetical protein [Monosiga brevicollis MX1]
MDLQQLSLGLDYVASNGIVLSTEKRVALQTSLVLLQHAEKLEHMTYWGKIQGLTADYYIAQGYNQDPFQRKNFMSLDCIKWAHVADVHPVLIASAQGLTTRFTGNPSHEYTVASLRKEETKSDNTVIVTTTLSEEKRLAAVIHLIDQAARVVPRGAYRKTPGDKIEKSHTFSGLSFQDAGKIDNYMHCREPETLKMKTNLQLAKLDPALDFLDSLADDIPKRCWSIQYQKGATVAVLRSVVWPGAVFYHGISSPIFGHVYVGTGLKNLDLIFMIS